tara:strand:- start:1263 stop:2987 length:1725 start_codon:yes stop_codon:yes gene_type:complete
MSERLDLITKFCSEQVRTKDGRLWTAEGRPWVLDEFYGPADSYKWWPNDPERLCPSCDAKIGTFVDYGARNPTTTKKHAATGCAGLRMEPVVMTVLNLPRREGKTFSTAAYILAQLFTQKNKSIVYVASSGEQAAALFYENYQLPIEQNPKLKKACTIVGSRIQVKTTKSRFEFVRTSHASITGRGLTHVVIDEARDIPGRVAMSLIPSVFAETGYECPRGHVQYRELGKRKTCPVCKSKLIPWHGRIIIMSSSGLIEGTEKDWFPQLVDKLESEPHRNAHLYRRNRSENPDRNSAAVAVVDEVFGELEATKHYVDIEVHNQATRKGEEFLTHREIIQTVDQRLTNQEGSAAPCVAFLDTSRTRDLTSLVIVADDTSPEDPTAPPWDSIRVERIDVWSPQNMAGGVINEAAILEHLALYMPLFPGMIDMRVDTRIMPWATRLVKIVRREFPSWGRRINGYNGGRMERRAAYRILEQRILAGKLRIPNNALLISELKAARRKMNTDGQLDIREASREKRHLELVDSLATCCYFVHLDTLQTRTRLDRIENRNAAGQALLARLYKPGAAGLNINKF